MAILIENYAPTVEGILAWARDYRAGLIKNRPDGPLAKMTTDQHIELAERAGSLHILHALIWRLSGRWPE
jgi:hypothetical protein